MDDLRILGPALGQPRTGLVSFVSLKRTAAEISFYLDRDFQIATRAGLHCAPLAHQTIGTLTTGAVRASVGCFTTSDEVEAFLYALREIVG
jgi:selenocysteine lyase/cysteine desulfurase